MLGLVRHARACPRFSKITKQQYLWEGLSCFVYLVHVVTHPWKLQCYHVVLVGYGPACPKFSEATNHQYRWKGSCDFVDFLQVVICILLDVHWSYKNILFWTGILRHSLWANQIIRCFNLKNSKRIWDIKWIFCFHWNVKKYFAILGYDRKILLANQFSGYFTFGLFNLLNLILGVHSYIVLVYFLFAVIDVTVYDSFLKVYMRGELLN